MSISGLSCGLSGTSSAEASGLYSPSSASRSAAPSLARPLPSGSVEGSIQMVSLRGHKKRKVRGGLLHGNSNDLAGMTFGKWTVLSHADVAQCHIRWNCRCSCGTETVVYACHLRSGKSTGCRKCRAHYKKHGKTGSALHTMWMGMHARCNATTGENYRNYKARGISVCDRWKDFSLFEADMGARPSDKHSIDRIDNSKGYEPGNCYWATSKQQMRNMRRNRLVEYGGRIMPLVEACELAGVNYGTAKWRLKNGKTIDEALS